MPDVIDNISDKAAFKVWRCVAVARQSGDHHSSNAHHWTARSSAQHTEQPPQAAADIRTPCQCTYWCLRVVQVTYGERMVTPG